MLAGEFYDATGIAGITIAAPKTFNIDQAYTSIFQWLLKYSHSKDLLSLC
jgi:hypothetical protein